MADAQGPSQQKVPIRTADPKIEDGSASIDRLSGGPHCLQTTALTAASSRLGARF